MSGRPMEIHLSVSTCVHVCVCSNPVEIYDIPVSP